MPETVLVTGGTGFVAGWCIAALLERGHTVRATVRSPSKEAAVRRAVEAAGVSSDRLACFVADLTDDAGWDAALAGCDSVLHVASPLGAGPSRDPEALVAPARDGTLRVLRGAIKAGVRRVVMTSAAATARPASHSDKVSDETVWADPADPQFDAYRRSKILAERAAWDFMAREGGQTSLTTILPGAVFGPVLSRESLGSVQVIQGLLNGRPPGLPRIGFWVVDVRDLAELHVRALGAPEAPGQRFLATGEFLWLEDIARILRASLGDRARKVPTRRWPDFVVRFLARFVAPLRPLLPFLGRVNPVTSEKARRVLGFSPRPAKSTLVDCAESLLQGE